MQSPSLALFSILHRLDVSGLACHCLNEPKLEGVVLQASIFNDSMDILILPFEISIWNSFCSWIPRLYRDKVRFTMLCSRMYMTN
ncbi:uncharacterized protein F5891DRAFT_577085 [Suillus fuscotomentosus]|uniref:Uncharacterized protein n=1 Tax=Suillus fuscotomentosus TaxID=1912939 RepID=A0AAD4HHM2_9AGAM|nr:uncharacterized protein F5891DRAFT_577085 [Suillus fuscotomentosus]KAG1896817.1 hypothetical protein F5891DRAFT_577085 [Suillus fuscotomentosus]